MQKRVVVAAEEKIKEEIANNFDINSSLKAIRIVDVGCSYGTTTILAVQNIVEAIKSKYKSKGLEDQIPEFQVFFNDLQSNDFNTLFKILPPNREYFAAALPGTFYKPLLPRESLHVVHSSNSLNWLSEIPREVLENTSPAWNRGRIHYINARVEVMEAYAAQYAKDWETFLCARAHDVAVGGLMALLVPVVPDEVDLSSETLTGGDFLIFESCLIEMVMAGVINEEQVDSLNLGFYFSSPKELNGIVQKNGLFSIVSMEKLHSLHSSSVPLEKRTLILKAGLEGIFKRHFASDEVVDEIFCRFSKKVVVSSIHLHPENNKMLVLFLLLKRKP
ncbi:loganic acid O-methyltransferase-like [Ziziphus jujuba]|uniref:Loganic acid O-methyltransferase-like n=1 Tax=Ziziphus jujuba TaxID=326968 RepID=A0ABM3ZXF2_ZIZJJ|nr:loganic acid O-methyltransferase-like [Ziziphus jujuba]